MTVSLDRDKAFRALGGVRTGPQPLDPRLVARGEANFLEMYMMESSDLRMTRIPLPY
jgi:hypothetical protein